MKKPHNPNVEAHPVYGCPVASPEPKATENTCERCEELGRHLREAMAGLVTLRGYLDKTNEQLVRACDLAERATKAAEKYKARLDAIRPEGEKP